MSKISKQFRPNFYEMQVVYNDSVAKNRQKLLNGYCLVA